MIDVSSSGVVEATPPTMVDVLVAATADAMTVVERYAGIRLARGASAWCGESAEDLARGALAATVVGDSRWAWERSTFVEHLCAVIDCVLARHRREELRTVRLDHLADDDARGAAVDAATERDPDLGRALDRTRGAQRVLAWVYAAATDDLAVLAYVDAVNAGCGGPRAVAAHTGLTIRDASAARRRMVRLLQHAPVSLRESVAAWLS